MDEIKNLIEKIIRDIQDKKEKISIPQIPKRCESCIDGDFQIDGISFNCDSYGQNSCLIYQNFLKENFGKTFLNISLDKVEESIREKIERYINNIQKFILYGKGLTIIGSVGSGKTSILFLIIQELFKKYYPFYYNHSYKIFEEQDESLLNKKILLIDDLGVEVKNEWNKSFFDYLIDYRYRFKLTTIITSNLSEKKLKDEYPRAMDRLSSMNFKIFIQGGSRR
ncbi:MAG: hypothetical protein N3D74_04560 [Caldisericia bacterium]|nr:hypothetical protein [Caldisericia bacterium]